MTGSSATPAAELAANRANWDERVPTHLRAHDADGFVADAGRISSIVRDDLALMAPHLPGGSPAELDLVHLQCHIGTDTLSWLADLRAWACTIAALLRPGGLFFVRDSHPVLNAMDYDDPDAAAGKLVLT